MGPGVVIRLGWGLKVNPGSGRNLIWADDSVLGRQALGMLMAEHRAAFLPPPDVCLLAYIFRVFAAAPKPRTASIIWPVSSPPPFLLLPDCYPGRHRAFRFTGQIILPEDGRSVCGAATATSGGLILSEEMPPTEDSGWGAALLKPSEVKFLL